jgi:D-alanyl-D-alanine carboxypeptidase (penicillin-binding protein 5/6)
MANAALPDDGARQQPGGAGRPGSGGTGSVTPGSGEPRAVGAASVPPPPRPPGGTVYSAASPPAAAARAAVQPVTPPAAQPPAAQPPAAPPARPRRRGRMVALPIVVLVVLGALSSGVAWQLHRALPAATLTVSVADTLRIPGRTPAFPWPAKGSAELMVDGLGRLGGSAAGRPAPIGSVAKVMTAYVVLTGHPLEGDGQGPGIKVTAADVADYRARIPSGQSLVPVAAGETLTERDALEALMLPSANNVAHLLAGWDAGSQEAFVAKMNAAAAGLGLTGTRYTDPSGFLPSTVSTAADQVILARAALKLPIFAKLVALRSARIPVAGRITNYNDLLGVDGVFGIKTGSTGQAGGNLVFAAHLTAGGRTLTVVGAVFNQPGAGTAQQLARVDTVVRRLLATVRRVVREYTLLAAGRVGRVTTAWGDTTTVSTAAPVRVVGWPGLAVPVRLTRTAPGAEVRRGEVVGSVTARPGASAVRVDLRTDGSTAEPGLRWKLTRRP